MISKNCFMTAGFVKLGDVMEDCLGNSFNRPYYGGRSFSQSPVNGIRLFFYG